MLTLRKAMSSDMLRFLDWRNDSAVIASSLSSSGVEQKKHQRWFQRKLADPNSYLYVLEHATLPAGQIRFELDGTAATVHYSLAADYRGRGLATPAMICALNTLRAECPSIVTVLAAVQRGNTASCRVFEKLGFELVLFDEQIRANRYRLCLREWRPLQPDADRRLATTIDPVWIEIAGRLIGPDYPPYVIAELSANHNGSIDNAFKLIEAAAIAGADAIKIQTYRADTITIRSDKPEFQIHGGLWDGQTLYELYDRAHTPWEWHEALFGKAREVGITLFSSPFDATAVDLLETLDAPAYKIASFEAVDLPLIRRVAQTGKPMIISTGMANLDEIGEAIDTARGAGCQELVVLHCISGYPAPAEDYNLRTMADIGSQQNVLTGLSDHTLDNATAIAAVALGACAIEKHITLDRHAGGPDDSFSLEPADLSALCRDCLIAWQALGRVDYSHRDSEKGNVQFRRSLYVVEDVNAGDVATTENIKSIRPGYGLAPKYYDQLLGRRFKMDVERATPASLNLFDDEK